MQPRPLPPRWQAPPLGDPSSDIAGLSLTWWVTILLVGAVAGAYVQTELQHKRQS